MRSSIRRTDRRIVAPVSGESSSTCSTRPASPWQRRWAAAAWHGTGRPAIGRLRRLRRAAAASAGAWRQHLFQLAHQAAGIGHFGVQRAQQGHLRRHQRIGRGLDLVMALEQQLPQAMKLARPKLAAQPCSAALPRRAACPSGPLIWVTVTLCTRSSCARIIATGSIPRAY
jgi:hypothetical protein